MFSEKKCIVSGSIFRAAASAAVISGMVAGVVPLLGTSVKAYTARVPESVFPNPGLANPRMQFNTGKVVNGGAQISPLLPQIPGSFSGWVVTMWHRSENLLANEMITNDRRFRDTELGMPVYAFVTPNHKAHLAIYRDHDAHRWVYDMFEKSGHLYADGGANLFLSASARGGPFTMNHSIVYNLWAKISQADVKYYNANAARNGAVLAMAFSGFILKFQGKNPGQTITLFMQIHLTDSRPWVRRKGGITYEQCASTPTGVVLIADIAPPGGEPFRFRTDSGPLHHLHYRLNSFLREVLDSKLPHCQAAAGTALALIHHSMFTKRVRNLEDWTLDSMFVGLETENCDYRPVVQRHFSQKAVGEGRIPSLVRPAGDLFGHRPQGSVCVALQIAGVSVVAEP